MKFWSALIFLILLLIDPQDSLAAAREAFALWQQTVAPSLLPFFAVLPALTCREAADAYARALNRPCRLLGLPGELGGAVGVALAAGSPAGAKALVRIASRKPLPAGALFRAALLCSGVSPGFLLSGVGAGMLNDPGAGTVLALSQCAALIASAWLLRWLPLPEAPLSLPAAPEGDGPPAIPFAVGSALSILGWTVLFAAGARILQRLLPPACAALVPPLAEFSLGCRHVCGLNLPRDEALPLLGAVIGFGGACAGCQNLSALKPLGIPPQMYFAAKAAQAALCALFCRWFAPLRWSAPALEPVAILPLLAAACAALFLRSRRRGRSSP